MIELLDEDSVREFVEEAREHIVSLNRDLLELEERGAEAGPDLINSAFRAIHTVKGNSGMLGLDAVNGLSHRMEDALSEVRRGKAVVSGDLASALFESLDVLSEMVEALAAGDAEERDVGGPIAELDAALRGGRAGRESAGAAPAESRNRLGDELLEEHPTARPSAASQVIRVEVARLDRILALVGELVVLRSRYSHLRRRYFRRHTAPTHRGYHHRTRLPASPPGNLTCTQLLQRQSTRPSLQRSRQVYKNRGEYQT